MRPETGSVCHVPKPGRFWPVLSPKLTFLLHRKLVPGPDWVPSDLSHVGRPWLGFGGVKKGRHRGLEVRCLSDDQRRDPGHGDLVLSDP